MADLYRANRANISEEEWACRVELATLFRAIAKYGMSDLVNGAISARVPGEPDHYLAPAAGCLGGG